MARVDARRHPVRRGPCRRLRLPDRDDVPCIARRSPGPRGADHVPRPPSRAIEDVTPDRRRGARRRRSAEGRRAARPPRPPRRVVRLDPTDGNPRAPIPGLRVVLDARPLQEPERAPTTAAYLGALLAAYDADPLEGESFALLLGSDLDDPTAALHGLSVVGRRLLPPTRLLRSGALTVDPFVLRGASLGAAWRAERGGAAGA